MANNHAGDVDHGKEIIKEYHKICLEYKNIFEFVFKFQYRNLETFIRKDMKGDFNIPLIKRFSETRLTISEFENLLSECKIHGFGTMITPFDEESVQQALDHNVDYLKIASCSFGDWPLLEAIVNAGKPIVASCAGATEDTIDNVVSFFRNRNVLPILQHCVGNYPTAPEDMNVGQVKYLADKYPYLQIGFSSHEDPSTVDIAPLALALGAKSFEKHVALETDVISKNKYSTSPVEFSSWLNQLVRSSEILGYSKTRYQSTENEVSSLRKLQRGVFLSRSVNAGATIDRKDVYFAFENTTLD